MGRAYAHGPLKPYPWKSKTTSSRPSTQAREALGCVGKLRIRIDDASEHLACSRKVPAALVEIRECIPLANVAIERLSHLAQGRGFQQRDGLTKAPSIRESARHDEAAFGEDVTSGPRLPKLSPKRSDRVVVPKRAFAVREHGQLVDRSAEFAEQPKLV